MEDEAKAKELLAKYRYSTFFMARESMEEYNWYTALKIPKEKILEWVGEYQRDLREKCYSSENNSLLHDYITEYCFSIENYHNTNNLDELIALVNFKNQKLDSFTKMRIAEDILNVVVKALTKHGFAKTKVTID